jgi:hypothetical protein
MSIQEEEKKNIDIKNVGQYDSVLGVAYIPQLLLPVCSKD